MEFILVTSLLFFVFGGLYGMITGKLSTLGVMAWLMMLVAIGWGFDLIADKVSG